jgi:serine/threonine protein kinase
VKPDASRVAEVQASNAAALAAAAAVAAAMPPVNEPELPPGSKLGPYRIVRAIGRGGIGTVYAATDTNGRQVAIKVLSELFTADEELLWRFAREARALSKIAHPNIVETYEFGEAKDGGRPYIVMEYLRGHTLRMRRRMTPPLDFRAGFRIFSECCDALEAAHAAGVVHRDLKPDNIFLAEFDGRERVKLLDFGAAKMLDASAKQTGVSGGVMGTPAYMSPEHCLGRPITARADIYSLGLVMFHLFTGRRPFGNLKEQELVMAQVSVAPPRPNSLAWMPDALDELIRRCLEKLPEDRPSTAAELRASLRAIRSSMEPADLERQLAPRAAQAVPAAPNASAPPAKPAPRPQPTTTVVSTAVEVAVPNQALIPKAAALRTRSGTTVFRSARMGGGGDTLRQARWIAVAAASLVAIVTTVALVRGPSQPPPSVLKMVELVIDTVPSGAAVYRPGQTAPVGETPYTVTMPSHPSELATFMLRMSGFEDAYLKLPLSSSAHTQVPLSPLRR